MTLTSGTWKALAYPLSVYGATQGLYIRVNAGIDGLFNGKLEQILNDAGGARHLMEVVPYSLAALLLIEGMANYLRGPKAQKAPQRIATPQPNLHG